MSEDRSIVHVSNLKRNCNEKDSLDPYGRMRCIFFRLGTGNRFRIRCKSRRKHLEPDAGRRSQVQSGFHRRRIRRLPYLQLVRRIGRRTLFASRQQDQGLRRQAAYGLPEHSRSRQFLPDARHGAEGRRSARRPKRRKATSKSMSRRCTRRSTCRFR